MKKIAFIFSFVSVVFSYSQEKEHYTIVTSQLKDLYNDANYEAIFDMFGSEMKQALPKERTLVVFKETKERLGSMKSLEFSRLENNAHVYKTTFDNDVQDFFLYLDPKTDKIGGLLITFHKPNDLPKLERNITKMILPIKEEWYVFWGGTSVENNYHVAYENQKFAYDLLMMKDGASYNGDPKKNDSYYVFGKAIIAPCDAKVVKVITGVKDNVPGELNPEQLTGNTIVLQTEHEEYILFAHLKEKSIVVKEGQMIKQGDLMGQCGNSGNTTEPHLHLSLQNVVDMNISTGGKIYFDAIMVNGELKEDYLPVKGDLIKNIN